LQNGLKNDVKKAMRALGTPQERPAKLPSLPQQEPTKQTQLNKA